MDDLTQAFFLTCLRSSGTAKAQHVLGAQQAPKRFAFLQAGATWSPSMLVQSAFSGSVKIAVILGSTPIMSAQLLP